MHSTVRNFLDYVNVEKIVKKLDDFLKAESTSTRLSIIIINSNFFKGVVRMSANGFHVADEPIWAK